MRRFRHVFVLVLLVSGVAGCGGGGIKPGGPPEGVGYVPPDSTDFSERGAKSAAAPARK
ncbi:hypothetical protein SAMN05444166_4345 [Singulisphaera sp. GP187]|uniref:hypothetical protein n=1 Tax=Singulisphaera sp. GP187 TaxID=1882752 RepID=UPI0009288ABA|nr:hypothetical protein [Singulisphaera sp. GP187]SIO39513.1 hypothetical protein SAMN05444166_4345 [Singulisphaera sp. GP187]